MGHGLKKNSTRVRLNYFEETCAHDLVRWPMSVLMPATVIFKEEFVLVILRVKVR